MTTQVRPIDFPLVSIIMPAFNAARYLECAVSSVRAQSYQNWELIVIDDASTDKTAKIVKKIARDDNRIRLYQLEENVGVARARNIGMATAGGKYIAFLDSDDIWRSNKLSKQVGFMEKTGCLICYSAYCRIDKNNSVLGMVRPPSEVDYKAMLRSNFIGNLTGIYNADILHKQYFKDYGHEDYAAWLALVKNAGKAIGLNEVLADYRVCTGSTSANKLKALSWQWKIYRGSQRLGVIYSSWLMVCYGYYAVLKRST